MNPPQDRTQDCGRLAAEWLVRLSAEENPAEKARIESAFAAWKRADPRHAEAAHRLESLLGQIVALREDDSPPARAILDRAQSVFAPKRRTRRAITLALAIGAVGLSAGLAAHGPGLARLTADIATAPSEWKTVTLADGSRLTLRHGAAVNVRMNATSREVELVSGEMLADVARDIDRPFLVTTPDGRIRALGTRFIVSRRTGQTELFMLHSRTEARASDFAIPARIVSAGQGVRITPAAIEPLDSIRPSDLEADWRPPRLVANDRPLPEVLDALGKYRCGGLHYDREALSRIRVFAVLPLDDNDKALDLLQDSLPGLRVNRSVPCWTTVKPARPG
ncbi:FecR family protein [Paludibacterium paludis]|uniref:FecR family protein n=1 Tax=Paludibacterium paludis TaxID=1225769 RepID=A0A918P092_9NEIS|nr:FecR domain-containing protein [Paludibacterium paludis]GGY09908.1 hypothetical protein GCM10011289_11000 [Paludibacterium paludis]